MQFDVFVVNNVNRKIFKHHSLKHANNPRKKKSVHTQNARHVW